MACLMNYTVQCVDVVSGKTGCFFFDIAHWQTTGEFKAISPVFHCLTEFGIYSNGPDSVVRRTSGYWERTPAL